MKTKSAAQKRDERRSSGARSINQNQKLAKHSTRDDRRRALVEAMTGGLCWGPA